MSPFLINIFDRLKLALFLLCFYFWAAFPFGMSEFIYKIKRDHGRMLPQGSVLRFFDSFLPQCMIYHIVAVVLAFFLLGGNIRILSTHGLKKVLGIISLGIVLIDIVGVLLFIYVASKV
jgi:hypothetical protein